MNKGFVGILLVFCCTSCLQEASPDDPIVLKKLAEKKKDYLEEVMLRCRDEAVAKAEMYVDSLFSEQIQISLNDSIYFPLKPDKPASKGVIEIVDFQRAEPVFKDSFLWKIQRDSGKMEFRKQKPDTIR